MMTGNYLVGQYKFTREFRNKDTQEVSKSFVLHVAYPNGLVLEKTIYFPRDEPNRPSFRDPNLTPEKVYAFPVEIRARKDGKDVSYTALRETPPMPTEK